MLITRLYTVELKTLKNYVLGGIKAKTLEEARNRLVSGEWTLEVFKPKITFKNEDRDLYTLPSVGKYFPEQLIILGDYYDTKQGARRLLTTASVQDDNGKNTFVANPMNNNSTSNGESWFTTGRMREGNYYEVTTTDNKKRGWISGTNARFGKEWYGFRTESTKPYVAPTTTSVVTPAVKPTQIVIPVVVKPTITPVKPEVKPLINQGYDNTFFVVEPPKKETNNIIPILGILLSAISIFK